MRREWIKVMVRNAVVTILVHNGVVHIVNPMIVKNVEERYGQTFVKVPPITAFSFPDFLDFARKHPILSKQNWEEYFKESLNQELS